MLRPGRERLVCGSISARAWMPRSRCLSASYSHESSKAESDSFPPDEGRSSLGSHNARKPAGRIPFESYRDKAPRSGAGPQTFTRKEGRAFRNLQELSAIAPEQRTRPIKAPSPAWNNPLSALDTLLDSLNTKQSVPKAKSDGPRTSAAKAVERPSPVRMGHPKASVSNTGWRLQHSSEYQKVCVSIERAQSDMEIWRILKQEVFGPVAKLNLDSSTTELGVFWRPAKPVELGVVRVDRLDTIGSNFAHILRHAAACLRRNFPTSPLPHCLVCELRRLGPSYFALGVTSELYNHALDQVLIQEQDFLTGLDILDEMDREVIEMDAQTLEILNKALVHARDVLKGRYGQAARIASQTERHRIALKDFRYRAHTLQRTLELA